MTKQVSIEIELSESEFSQLSDILGCSEDQLESALEPYCSAAAEEYVRLFLGQKVFTRGADFREYRLFLLVRQAFNNRIPSEQKICDLFQTTATRSRSLSKSVMSKFQYELSDAIERSMKRLVENAEEQGDKELYHVTVQNKSIVEALNQLLSSIDGSLPQINKKRGTVSTYKMQPSSYQKLSDHFELDEQSNE